MTPRRQFATHRGLGALVVAAASCGPPNNNSDGGTGTNVDIFMRAADDVPGGALLGVWVAPSVQVDTMNPGPSQYDRFAYIVGGYLDVDPATVPAPNHPGRLIGYEGGGRFTTLCSFDQPLRTVTGINGLVYAAGANGLLIQYDPRMHACTTLASASSFAPGAAPTFRGVAGTEAEMFLVGSVLDAGGMRRCTLYRFDGMAVAEVPVFPQAPEGTLHSISYQPILGYWVVGDHGMALRRLPGSDWELSPPQVPLHTDGAGIDDSVVGVSIEPTPTSDSERPTPRRLWTMAIAGDRYATILARPYYGLGDVANGGTWETRPAAQYRGEPLHAVFTSSEWAAYMVGERGAAYVFNGQELFVPTRNLTAKTLYAVHGYSNWAGVSGLVLAVGGDTTTHPLDQRGVIMIRSDFSSPRQYSVDGQTYEPFGTPAASFGGIRSAQ